MDNIKIKVSDISGNKHSEAARFSISYSSRKTDHFQVSHQIISALKADDDIIIELNSSLLNLGEGDRNELRSEFIRSLQEFGLEFVNKKVTVNQRRVIFSISLESKKIEGFELYALVPDKIWRTPGFEKIIPKDGVRYYLPKLPFSSDLNSFTILDEDEKKELCRMVIFDHILLGSMGINTSTLNKDNIKELLNSF